MGLKVNINSPCIRILVFCWNQTKMGLKDKPLAVCVDDPKMVEIRPKWDWKEVERLRELAKDIVEIRPKWDWKKNYDEFIKTLDGSLKSDQNGIERILEEAAAFRSPIVEIRPKWDWKFFRWSLTISHTLCWNQTNKGLKDILCMPQFQPQVRIGWNQTNKGLKVDGLMTLARLTT